MVSLGAFLATGATLALIGWGGLAWLFLFTLPTLGPRWLFYFLGMLALTGTALPLVAYLHQRFPSDPPVRANVIIRQAIWVGLFGDVLAWLQQGKVLTAALVIFITLGIIAIEILLHWREKSRWKPDDDGDE